MRDSVAPIEEYGGVDARAFREEILPLGRPAVLRRCAADWPVVAAARQSPAALADYLRRFDRGLPVETFVAPPGAGGRLFYRDDMRGLNFDRSPRLLGAVLDALLAHLGEGEPPALSAQAIEADRFVPGFAAENRLGLLPHEVQPRLWVGNAIQVAPHIDLNDNLAVVAAGRRRFILFPPEQLPNLYVGPFDFSPAGAPVSMVDPDAPDLELYPRYREALAAARAAELGPGDALYIPYMWWHGVRSLDGLNLLVNYWWNDTRPRAGSPYDALMHALLTLGDLPPAQRAAWATMFDTYVFRRHGDPLVHLPPHGRGALGGLDAQGVAQMRAHLARALGRR